ncbi:MAG TPA: DNA polymerase domain-containing protein [Anaerolineales bacterium]|nr:DNA polymerase domain-containing protein [Anaerolineales bacterium]
MTELTGWLLDLYADPQAGAVLWLVGEDGQRHRLQQDFPLTFYAAGPNERLRLLWRFLQVQPEAVTLSRLERRDLFYPQPLPVLAARVLQPAQQPGLFRRAAERFPDLNFYDADLPLALHHAAAYGTFPLARCRVETDAEGKVQALQVLDTPWELEPTPAPLRLLRLEPDVDPAHARPQSVLVHGERCSCRLSLTHPRPLLANLAAILRQQDPDLLLTLWGDTWLLPRLLALGQHWRMPLPLSRDPGMGVEHRPERTYFAYGQVIYRGRQVYLFGRWHIDGCNAMLFHEYGLEGVYELARVTSLPVQSAARLSPGSGISAMQMVVALRQGVLVPWHKQQAELPKSAAELMIADQGGLVYQPLSGLHRDVAEIDFISMYPSIMRHFNISPETVAHPTPPADYVQTNTSIPTHANSSPPGRGARMRENTPGTWQHVPELGLCINQEQPGLVPQTLAPLLDKRLALKQRQAELPAWDPRRQTCKAMATAHKWLLVTCFGYLGYKNARFGRIEAHQAVTAYGREALLQAKEAAEDLGYTVLHMYVDGLWVHKPGAAEPQTIQPLLLEIAERTGLPIALDGIYRWVAFLPSRVDARVPVANRYFGVFQDGSLKLSGLEARRSDTPPWIARRQTALIEALAKLPGETAGPGCLPWLMRWLRAALAELRGGRIPLEQLLAAQKLSRALDEYRTPSPAARAATQLAAVGKHLRAGQRVRFLYTLGEPGVHAWDLPYPPARRSLDLARYQELLIRAVGAVAQPFGIPEDELRLRARGGAPNATFWPALHLTG